MPTRHLHLDNRETHNTHAHNRTLTLIPKPNSLFFSLLPPPSPDSKPRIIVICTSLICHILSVPKACEVYLSNVFFKQPHSRHFSSSLPHPGLLVGSPCLQSLHTSSLESVLCGTSGKGSLKHSSGPPYSTQKPKANSAKPTHLNLSLP